MNNPTPESLQLEPCPFDGAKAVLEKTPNGCYWYAVCTKCCLHLDSSKTAKQAAKIWNTRTNIQNPLPNEHSGEGVGVGCTELVEALEYIWANDGHNLSPESRDKITDIFELEKQLNAKPNYKGVAEKLAEACDVGLGHLTGGLDGDWRDCDPHQLLREALAAYKALTPAPDAKCSN